MQAHYACLKHTSPQSYSRSHPSCGSFGVASCSDGVFEGAFGKVGRSVGRYIGRISLGLRERGGRGFRLD